MRVRHKLTGQELTVKNRGECVSTCYVEPREKVWSVTQHDYTDRVVICLNENLESVEEQNYMNNQLELF